MGLSELSPGVPPSPGVRSKGTSTFFMNAKSLGTPRVAPPCTTSRRRGSKKPMWVCANLIPVFWPPPILPKPLNNPPNLIRISDRYIACSVWPWNGWKTKIPTGGWSNVSNGPCSSNSEPIIPAVPPDPFWMTFPTVAQKLMPLCSSSLVKDSVGPDLRAGRKKLCAVRRDVGPYL